MFKSARIKLTAWYLLIIMFISLSFSAGIYKVLTLELGRVERVQRLRIERRFSGWMRGTAPSDLSVDLLRPFFLDPDLVTETKNRLAVFLALINLGIFSAAAVAGYFLSGRTLRPIKAMVDEQNRFITDASHELRTPLTSLKSEIEVSLRDQKMTLFEAKKLLRSNLEEVNNLQILSDGLIKLTQYQKGQNGWSFAPVSLAPIVGEAVRRVAALAKPKGILIENKVTDYLLDGDKTALTELGVIFLDNAVKYSPEKTRIKVTSEKMMGKIFLHIADEGVGIEEKDLPHLFDRFYRASKSRSKGDVAGYGLGLAIAKQIVERHGGSIKVQSQVGVGTIFTVILPQKR